MDQDFTLLHSNTYKEDHEWIPPNGLVAAGPKPTVVNGLRSEEIGFFALFKGDRMSPTLVKTGGKEEILEYLNQA